MIDGIKISTTEFDIKALFTSPYLTFNNNVDSETGEIVKNKYGNAKYDTNYNGLKVIVYHNADNKYTLTISGSIHKFYNKGTHNYNDFTYQELIWSINELEELFFFNVENCKVHNLEIGVNIVPPVKSKKVLKGLLSHHNKRFRSIAYDDANYYQAHHNNYYFKTYDKAKQYKAKSHNIDNEILRLELKYRKMIDLVDLLNKNGKLNRSFIVLNDLKDLEILKLFGELLVNKWNEILFYDYTISKNKLSKPQFRKLDVWQNINQWESYSKQCKYKEKLKLQNVIDNHSKQLQKLISNLIKEKFYSLLQKRLPFNQFKNVKKDDQLTTFNDDESLTERLPINSIPKGLNGNSCSSLSKSKNEGSIIPDYFEFHNDEREIPF